MKPIRTPTARRARPSAIVNVHMCYSLRSLKFENVERWNRVCFAADQLQSMKPPRSERIHRMAVNTVFLRLSVSCPK
jgi:hypothetical protein